MGVFQVFFFVCYISFAGWHFRSPRLCSREQEDFPMRISFSGDSGGPLKPTFIMDGGHLSDGGTCMKTDGGSLIDGGRVSTDGGML
jgi:hypothetical protein